MQRDCQDLEISGGEPGAIDAIDNFILALTSLGQGAEAVVKAADRHPDVPLLQSYAALFHLYAQSEHTDASAREYLRRAEQCAQTGSPREKLLQRALKGALDKRFNESLALLQEIGKQWPRDLVAAKYAEFLYYCCGQACTAERFLRHMQSIAPFNRDNPHFLSMYSFASELSRQYEDATLLARQAVDTGAQVPWAHHTLSHIRLMRGEIEAGITEQEAYRPGWDAANGLIRLHNTWHLGVLYLEQMELERARQLFEQAILTQLAPVTGILIDIIAMAWRLEMAGMDMAQYWLPICQHIAGFEAEAYMPFVNAHYVYALTRAGLRERVAEARAELRATVEQKAEYEKVVWAQTGLPLLEACHTFANGNNGRSALLLEPLMARVSCVGGSDAQINVFQQMYISSLRSSGLRTRARRYLEQISRDKKTLSALDRHWLSSTPRSGSRAPRST